MDQITQPEPPQQQGIDQPDLEVGQRQVFLNKGGYRPEIKSPQVKKQVETAKGE